MGKHERATFGWMDFLWLVFLAGLGVLPPLFEIHKQLILLAIGAFQILEHSLMGTVGESRGRIYSIVIKIGLASLLLDHTGGIRAFAAQGAAIVVGKGDGDFFRKALAAPRRSICSTTASAAGRPKTTSSMAPNMTRPLCTLVLPDVLAFWE